jgi:MGT family glycosyltransferase
MARILFVQPDSGGGAVAAIAVARRLRADGHEVRFLAARALGPSLLGAGFADEPFERTPDFGLATPETDRLRDWAARTPLGAMRATCALMLDSAPQQAADVLARARALEPDAIVCDMMLPGAFAAAEAAGVPCIGLIHTIGVLPLAGQPPLPGGLRPARGRPGQVRDALLKRGRVLAERRWVRPLSEVRAAHGLAPVGTLYEQWLRADRLLLLSSPAFDLPATRLPPNLRYVGPAFWEAPATTPAAALPDGPFVLASLSTTYQRAERYLATLVAALGRLGLPALVTTGPAYDHARLEPLPANVQLRSYAPHSQLLERAAAMVTHAGHGSVMSALAHGVPLVCVPFGRDQADVALRAQRTGAALRLRPRLLSARRLARTVRRVLDEPAYRQAARAMQTTLSAEDGAARAAEQIAEIAAR